MRIPVNLAREPFRRDRASLVGSAFVAVLLAGTLILLISLTRTERALTRDTQTTLDSGQPAAFRHSHSAGEDRRPPDAPAR